MKKFLLFISATLWALAGNSQDFAPSQQAQGYLDSKNVTVDYATGLFHYKVPLYTLKSGTFELPISLNYVGKGVKVDDQPGLIGYNWTLNTGGIVTRTIRGGIADEAENGYIYQNFNNLPTVSQVDSVNKRLIDGESDIFTAAFNGQSVNFILKKGNGKIIIEPLERTNVRIECEYYWGNNGSTINGWIITDENGNKYYFRQKEYSADIVKEDAISFNGVRGKTFISSWYINKIEPLNSTPIVYMYLADVKLYGSYENINTTKYYSRYESKYTYGAPMTNRPFDFGKYQKEFNAAIVEVSKCLNDYSLDMQLNNYYAYYVDSLGFVRNPNYETIVDNIDANFRVMGQLADLKGLASGSSLMIARIDQLIDSYSKVKSQGAIMAIQHLNVARSTIIQSLTETEQIITQTFGCGGLMNVKSPILTNIICNDKNVIFSYDLNKKFGYNSFTLKRINVADIAKNDIVQMQVQSSCGDLTQLSFFDKTAIEVNRIKFEYYKNDLEYISDIWGFPKQDKPNYEAYKFNDNVDNNYSKFKSLSKIVNSNQGEITINYESNIIPDIYAPYKYTIPFGGIRIKSLVTKDPLSNHIDSIKYNYPYSGELVYENSSNYEIIYHGNFNDQVLHSRIKNKGNAFLNTGNNGVYYDYVEEEFVGKGKKSHLFFNATRFLIPPEMPYHFWLFGIPLGTATYDKNGNLKSITKNNYQTDLDNYVYHKHNDDIANVCFPPNWFFENGNSVKYLSTKPQIKAYEHYMDAKQLSSYYKNQSDVPLYFNGAKAVCLNPYKSIYLPNIEPRTGTIFQEQRWNLKYGGKVLLKSQEEYKIEGNYSTQSSLSHYTASDLGTPQKKVNYYYDNHTRSTTPTRIVQYDSRGDSTTTIIKRVTEIDNSADLVIAKMKEDNILAPVIKQKTLKNNILLKELVSTYDTLNVSGRRYFGLKKQYSYYPLTSTNVSPFTSSDNILFEYGQTNYILEQSNNYKHKNNYYLPTSVETKEKQTGVLYDFRIGCQILKCEGCNDNMMSAKDYKRTIDYRFSYDDLIVCNDLYLEFCAYYNMYLDFDRSIHEENFINYINSQEHAMIIQLVEAIVTKGESMCFNLFEQLNDSIIMNNTLDNFFRIYNSYSAYFYPEFKHHVIANLMDKRFMSEKFFECLKMYDKRDLLVNNDTINISSIPNSKRLKLYFLSKNIINSITYTIIHSGGTSTGTITPISKNSWNMQASIIDLSNYSGITSVQINQPLSDNLAYIALVPDNCEFEATSYNSDGTVFCKFNQNCQMERYEYDGAGRILKVYDQNGLVLKENKYNNVIQ